MGCGNASMSIKVLIPLLCMFFLISCSKSLSKDGNNVSDSIPFDPAIGGSSDGDKSSAKNLQTHLDMIKQQYEIDSNLTNNDEHL